MPCLPLTVMARGACVTTRVGFFALSFASSALTLATVGAAPLPIAARTRLFLSWNVTWPPLRFWAQPSGYFIEKPSFASLKVRKFWLSGMSPVAADLASADSASGDPEPALLVVLEPDELPQPVTAAAPAAAMRMRCLIDMARMVGAAP